MSELYLLLDTYKHMYRKHFEDLGNKETLAIFCIRWNRNYLNKKKEEKIYTRENGGEQTFLMGEMNQSLMKSRVKDRSKENNG